MNTRRSSAFRDGRHYRISNKTARLSHFLMQANFGNSNGANTWPERPDDGDYDISGYECALSRKAGDDYELLNRRTGQALTQTDLNEWDVDVAPAGTFGTVWTLEEHGEYFRIVNKVSGVGLFQAD